MSRRSLSRRRLLRGCCAGSAVALGVPILDAMLNLNGNAFADGEIIPKRYGVWFFAGGVKRDWAPTTTGPLMLPSEFSPLERHKQNLTFVSGLSTPSFGNYSTNRHIMGTAGGLSGYPPNGGAFSSKSYDQIVAEQLASGTRTSLEVGVWPNGTAETGTGWDNISHSGPNNPNPAEFDPAKVYASLFGDGLALPSSMGTGIDESPLRAAYLDAVREDAADLKRELGGEDRARLDAFLDGLREIEAQLQGVGTGVNAGINGCADPMAAPVSADANKEESNVSMSKLVAAALACQITQVFTFQYTRPNAFITYPGMPDSHHNLGHSPQHDRIGDSTRYTMERFADFLDALAEINEGEYSLLENSVVLLQSDTAWDHDLNNALTVIGGRAGGALLGNQHVRGSGASSKAPLTLARAAGANIDAWGTDDAQTGDSINEILA